MSLRIRKDGTIHCAAIHPDEQPGDVYLDDWQHYQLSVVFGLLVTEPMYLESTIDHRGIEYSTGGRGGHAVHGEWWWRTAVPDDVYATIDWWPRLQPVGVVA